MKLFGTAGHKYAAGDLGRLSYVSRHTRDAHTATAKCTFKYSPHTRWYRVPMSELFYFSFLFIVLFAQQKINNEKKKKHERKNCIFRI